MFLKKLYKLFKRYKQTENVLRSLKKKLFFKTF